MCINAINTVNIVSTVKQNNNPIKTVENEKLNVTDLSKDSISIDKKKPGAVPNSNDIFQPKNTNIIPLKESYPSDFGYGRPDFNYPFPDFYPPVYDDPFSWNKPEPSTPDEMRFAYRNALSRNNGYELLRLSKVENEKQLLPDVKAGDILYNAYQIAFVNKDPNLLLNISKYENKENLLTMKAGDILQDAYDSSRIRRDARSMMDIAVYENSNNIMIGKAGDILYEAYQTAKSNRDISTMLKIADYEENFDIMTISASQIRSEAYNIRPGW